MFHINNQVTYRPKKRPSIIDKKKINPNKRLIIKKKKLKLKFKI